MSVSKETYKATLKAGLIAAFNSSKEGSTNNYDDGVIDAICEVAANAQLAFASTLIVNVAIPGPPPLAGTGTVTAP